MHTSDKLQHITINQHGIIDDQLKLTLSLLQKWNSFVLNWLKQARGRMRRNYWWNMPLSGFEPVVIIKVIHIYVFASMKLPIIISPKFENFGDIMLLVAPSPPPAPPPPPSPSPPAPSPHANACTGHNFVTNTPIKFIFDIAIEVPDYKNPMIFGINRNNKMASGGHFV